MSIQKKRVDITSADSIQIGFEYQYLYFMSKLFQLHQGEEVGYESLDDVHKISFRDGKTYLYQLKHTIKTDAMGGSPNLTNLSEDMWKTLSNWSKLISDSSEGREKKKEQKTFINKSYFILVVNRKLNTNDVVDYINQVKIGKMKCTSLIDYLNQLKDKTIDKSIKTYIEDVINLGVTVLELYIKHIEFVDTPSNLFEVLRDNIRDKMIPDEYIDDVLGKLYLELKEDFFDRVSHGQHQTINYAEWINNYRGIFNQCRSTLLPLRSYSPILPEHLEKQNFVKELIEIGAIDLAEDGLSEIAELTNHYITIRLQLEAWHQEGKISLLMLQQFEKDSILQWKTIHRASHRHTATNKNLDCSNALDCFDDVMKEKLSLLSTELGLSLSNGEFIWLADEEKIGWKYSWKERYFSDGNK